MNTNSEFRKMVIYQSNIIFKKIQLQVFETDETKNLGNAELQQFVI